MAIKQEPNFQTISGQTAYVSPPVVASRPAPQSNYAPSAVTPPTAGTLPSVASTPTPSATNIFNTPSGAQVNATTGALVAPPTPSKDINLTIPQKIPSDILASAPTSGQVLTKAKSLQDQFQEYLTQRQAEREKLTAAMAPSIQETELRKQLTDLNIAARNAIFKAEQSGETTRFAAGETGRVQRQATIEQQNLVDQINMLVDSRKTQVDAIKSTMDFDQENFNALLNLSKLTTPDVLKTDTNPQTGDVVAIIQDPSTGEITSKVVGNIGVNAKNQYTHQGTYQNDATGQTYFYGVKADGKIDTIALPGSAGLKPTGIPGGLGVGLAGLDINHPDYIFSLMKLTAGRKAPNQVETLRPIQKSVSVINQLSGLQESIDKTVTDPILGTLRQFNPYDFDARAIQSQLQATVPNLARGVYGEVGVLTDQDIKNYIQTLPNIKGTKAQNDFVMAMTLKTVQRNLESQLETLASSGYDISGFENQYQKVLNSVKTIEDEIGVTKQSQINISPEKESIFKSIVTQPTQGGYFGNLWKAIMGQ